jgi:hypothetical protein
MKPARKSIPSAIILCDEDGPVMSISHIDMVIVDPKRAALIMVKDVLAKPRFTNVIRYNGLVTVYVTDHYAIQRNIEFEEPNYWSEFVEEFQRVINMKAFA